MSLAGPPVGPVSVPAMVRSFAAGRPTVPVWRNQLGGITWRVGDPAEHYVKWQPPGVDGADGVGGADGLDFDAEAERLAWLAPHTPVPEVVERGGDDEGDWLVSIALPGESAVDERWTSDPETAVRAIGVGLRRFHDAVPVEGCPFDWSVETRSRARGAPDIGHPPPIDRLVVCHGDACAPNTLVDDRGDFVAHVDVGSAGVADRWADLAVASWSLDWNFGEGRGVSFFDAYGIEPDADRIAFYRRLWDVT